MPRQDAAATGSASHGEGNSAMPSASIVEPRVPFALAALLFVTSFVQYTSLTILSLFIMIDLDYEPVQLAQYWMYLGWSAWLSPVVGWISDAVLTVRGERRRPTIVIGVVCNIVLWYSIFQFGEVVPSVVFVLLSIAQAVAQMLVSVPINALVVECAIDGSTEQIGEVQSIAMMHRTAGSLVGAVVQTVGFFFISNRTMLVVCACMNVLILVPLFADRSGALHSAALPSGFFDDADDDGDVNAEYDNNDSVTNDSEGEGTGAGDGGTQESDEKEARRALLSKRDPLGNAKKALSCCSRSVSSPLRGVYRRWRRMTEKMNSSCAANKQSKHSVIQFVLVLVFVFVYSSMPDGSVIYNEYVSVHFNFPTWFLSVNFGMGLLGSIVGSWLYTKTIARFSPEPFLLFCGGAVFAAGGYGTNIMFATGFTRDALHIPNEAFVPFDSFMVSLLSRVAFMPVLHVAAERCPKGYEAFVYELFTIATLGASSVSALGTARIAAALHITTKDWSQLWMLLLLCAAGRVFPIFFGVALLPPVRDRRKRARREGGDIPQQKPRDHRADDDNKEEEEGESDAAAVGPTDVGTLQ